MKKTGGRPSQVVLSSRRVDHLKKKKSVGQFSDIQLNSLGRNSNAHSLGRNSNAHSLGRNSTVNAKVNYGLDDLSTDSDSFEELREEREQILTIETGPPGVLGDIDFVLMGGRDNGYYPDDTSLYFEEILEGSSVEGTIEAGDQLLKVGGVYVDDVPLHVALNLIRAADSRVVINILKHPDNKMPIQISDSDQDSGPEPDEDELAEEICSTFSRVSKASHGNPATATVMVDETDDGEEVDVGFMSGRPGHLDDMDFEFAGGKDKPFIPKNSGLFITSIKLSSILEEHVSIGDKIIKLEGVDVTNVPQFVATNLIRASHGKAFMTIKKATRQHVSASAFSEGGDFDVSVNALGAKDEFIVEIKTGPKGRSGQLGFKITGGRDKPCVPGDPGIFIKEVKPGSKIEKLLRPGYKILKIDGKSVTHATQSQVKDMIKVAEYRVLLHIKKSNVDQERKEQKTISEMFDSEKLQEFVSAFEYYSTRKDNKVAVSRLPNLCRALGFNLTSQDVEYMLTEHDNVSGRITFPEFIKMIHDISSHLQKDSDILEAFQVFDSEGVGFFAVEELKAAFQHMPGYSAISIDEMEDIVKIADSNGDGKVYYQDFKDLVLPIFHKY